MDNNLIKQEIHFYKIEDLAKKIKKGDMIDYVRLGIRGDVKLIISQILYRDKKIKKNPYELYVNKNTFLEKNIRIIKYILNDILLKDYHLGLTNTTIIFKARKIIEFFNWLILNDKDYGKNKNDARNAYQQYTFYLKGKVRTSDISFHQAKLMQLSAKNILKTIFEDNENIIAAGIKNIGNGNIFSTMKKSEEVDQKYHFNFYVTLFNSLYHFLLENKPFPYQINIVDKKYWLLPSTTLFNLLGKESRARAFDPFTGKTRDTEEIFNLYNYKQLCLARIARDKFLANINKNNNYYSRSRLVLATIALKAYYIYFLTITGMNDSTAATLKWNGVYEEIKEEQKFRNIKYRANNKIVEFKIQNKFIGDFKKFLKLREYLLCEEKDPGFLFFTGYSKNAKLSNVQKRGVFCSTINSSMSKSIDQELPNLSSRQLRVNKTHQIIKQDGEIAASQISQSALNTILKYYTGDSQSNTDKQLTQYFTKLNKSIIIKQDKGKNTSVGQCLSVNNPKITINLKGIKKDCSQAEGCLFCEHYGCHVDEEDIRKLMSLKFIINECFYISKDENHFQSIYGTVLKRLKDILNEIKKRGNSMIEKIYNDVYTNENLHPYWEHKLKMLVEIGVF